MSEVFYEQNLFRHFSDISAARLCIVLQIGQRAASWSLQKQ